MGVHNFAEGVQLSQGVQNFFRGCAPPLNLVISTDTELVDDLIPLHSQVQNCFII